jgi:hypothetical protein
MPRRRTLATGIHALRSLDGGCALGILPSLAANAGSRGIGQPLTAFWGCAGRCYFASIVTPGKSSVRNGVSGRPAAEYMLHTGLSAQA